MKEKVYISKSGELLLLHKYNSQGAEIGTMLISAQTAKKVATELKKIMPKEVLKALIDKYITT